MKPLHAGHWNLIERASRENERVDVLVSTADRKGIKGEDMVEVWERFLIPRLPANVAVTFVKNPIRHLYTILGEASQGGSIDTFVVYSDPDDIRDRFPMDSQLKYFGPLVKRGQVAFEAVERLGETDISGTQMRTFLERGMRDEFMSFLPEGIDALGVWNVLSGKRVLRNYITGQVMRKEKKR